MKKTKIYTMLESGFKGGYVLSADQVEGLGEMGGLLSEDLIIKGGPLSDDLDTDALPQSWKQDDGTVKIPKGTAIENVLSGLFFKEILGTVDFKLVWDPKLGTPTLTLKQGDASISNNAYVEVGSEIKVEASVNKTVNNKNKVLTITSDPTDNGVFIGDEWNESGTTITKEGTANTDNLQISEKTVTVGEKTVDITNIKSAFTVEEGDNVVKVKQSGANVTADNIPDTILYASTNTKVKQEDTEETFKDSLGTTKDAIDGSASKTVKGSYKYYIGYADSVPDTTDDVKNMTMLHSDWMAKKLDGKQSFMIEACTFPAGKTAVIAIPEGNQLANIENAMGLLILNNFYVEGEKEPKTLEYSLENGETKSYKIYSNAYTADIECKNITINKVQNN